MFSFLSPFDCHSLGKWWMIPANENIPCVGRSFGVISECEWLKVVVVIVSREQ